ncbi:MAG: imidazole glycerol phosphate synthase subunit HisF [Bacteroidales bacterium]|jgi:cyclase|nr:imidazole glycerol phosphate synthase subunit HisF [Bacteroidales bacterium]
MLAKRIIACLDVKDGQTVKGVSFENLRYAGDPVELGKAYSEQGVDELVYLDITATNEGRKQIYSLVEKVAQNLSIPFTIGGGISGVEDAENLLIHGADKISVNSAAVRNPQLVSDLALKFGKQFVVVAIDAKTIENQWIVHTHGGKRPTEKELFSWAKEMEDRGAGEILFTSMNHDGHQTGFANEALCKLSEMLSIPVIASGGAGEMSHFKDVFQKGKADAALAASIFHFGKIAIPDLKQYLIKEGINVRI